MSKKIIAFLFFLLSICQLKSQQLEQIVLGTKHSLHSKILNEDRAYYVSLPDSYTNEKLAYKTYPLLIVLDGNVHFKTIATMVNNMSSDSYRSWKIPEMIVIGIQNVDRRRDYTPDKVITVRENNSGGGENFLRFLKEELIPEMDKKYRTDNYRILFGHSLGGLLATHAYMKTETPYKAFMAIDPSFGTWDEATMDGKLDKVTDHSFERYIYMATANWGKRNINNRDRHIRLYEALNSKCEGGFPAKLEYFENESHASVPPIAFQHGISSIFEGYGISYREVESIEGLTKHFQVISKRLSWNFPPPEYLVNQLGYSMLQSEDENDQSKAIAFFALNVENYPLSNAAYENLGEAYKMLGDDEKAIENYKKSLELYPDNEEIRRKLSSLSENK